MSTSDAGAGTTCAETAGFLFSHACTRAAVSQCERCHKRVCSQHSRRMDTADAAGARIVCTSCAKKVLRRERWRERDDVYDRDPFFYSYYYYNDYGYYRPGSWGYHHYHDPDLDPNDFHEADGASLYDDGEQFEHDMGAS